ncbi:MAG: glutaredoxin family protein [Pseudomonadota bacterium]
MEHFKKLVIVGLAIGIYQNWDAIQGYFAGTPDYISDETSVVLYATEWCGYCEKTRKLFARNNIPYVEHDIEKSKDAERAYRALGGRGVPVVHANGVVVHGYSEARLMNAVKQQP